MIIDEEPVSELTLEVINDGIEDTSETTSLGGTPKPDDESVVAPEHFVEQNQNVVEKPKIEKKKLSEKKLAQLKKARESKMRKREAKKIEDAKDIIAKASESEPPPPLERLSDGPPPEPKEISEPIEIVYKKKKKKKKKIVYYSSSSESEDESSEEDISHHRRPHSVEAPSQREIHLTNLRQQMFGY
jgi:hypothetical protein